MKLNKKIFFKSKILPALSFLAQNRLCSQANELDLPENIEKNNNNNTVKTNRDNEFRRIEGVNKMKYAKH